MKQLSRGILISVEGIDGSGKSTLVHRLAQRLHDEEWPLIVTREPGATPLGTMLRSIVQQNTPRCAKAEYLLFAADRAQHFADIVLPALAQNKIVISDRMADSSIVYQGYGRGLDIATITTINRWTMEDRTPDITLYVNVDAATAISRLAKRNEALTAFEQEKHTFIEKLIHGFEQLFANNPRVLSIDGTKHEDDVAHNACRAVTQWLNFNL